MYGAPSVIYEFDLEKYKNTVGLFIGCLSQNANFLNIISILISSGAGIIKAAARVLELSFAEIMIQKSFIMY